MEILQSVNNYLNDFPRNTFIKEKSTKDDESKNFIYLDRNENPFGMSLLALTSITEMLTNLNRYPRNHKLMLQIAIANEIGVSPHQIVLSNGLDKILLLISQIFSNSQSEIIYPQYSFSDFYRVSKLIGAKANVIPSPDWKVDFKSIFSAINPKTKVIIIANPNNPTGAWFDHKALAQFLQQVPKNVLVVLDEAYYEYAKYHLGDVYPNAIELQKNHHNLAIARTFSKIYGLAGLRLGYIILHQEIAELMSVIDFPHCITEMSTQAAVAAMQDKPYIQKTLENNFKEMNRLSKIFTDIGLTFSSTPANFMLLNMGTKALDFYRHLLDKNIAVRPLIDYKLDHWLRISIGKPEENDSFIHELRKFCS